VGVTELSDEDVTGMNTIKSNKKNLSPEQREELLRALKARF